MSKKKLLFVTCYEKPEQKKEFEMQMKGSFLEKGKNKICLNFCHNESVEKIIQIIKKKRPEAIIFDKALSWEYYKKISDKLQKKLNGRTPSLKHSFITLNNLMSLSQA